MSLYYSFSVLGCFKDTSVSFLQTYCNLGMCVLILGFPDSSVGKEFACNAGDPGSIPVLGRSSGEEIGYPLQYSWASFVVQLVKKLPAVRESWVLSLVWEDLLEKGKASHFSILA